MGEQCKTNEYKIMTTMKMETKMKKRGEKVRSRECRTREVMYK